MPCPMRMDSPPGSRLLLRRFRRRSIPVARRFRADCGSGSSFAPRRFSADARRCLATLWLGDFDASAVVAAGVFAAAMLFVSRLLRDFPYPLRLLPASRIAVALLPVAAGAVAVGGLEVAQNDSIFVGARCFSTAAIAAAVAVAVAVISDRVLTANPIRIAVLGAADFVPAIRRELDAIGGRREIEVIGWLNLGGRYAADDRGPSSRRSTASGPPSPNTESTSCTRPRFGIVAVGPRRLRHDRRRLSRPAGPHDRRQPALRARLRPRPDRDDRFRLVPFPDASALSGELEVFEARIGHRDRVFWRR